MSSSEQELFDNILLTAFVVPLILALGMIVFIIFYLRKKHKYEMENINHLLKQQSLIIEKQEAVEKERTRIASEMHDDLGSGLTTIKYLSERALRSAENLKEASQIERIAHQSNRLVTNMSEIIWAMNSRFDNAHSLSSYVRRYASEYLEKHEISFSFMDETENMKIQLTGEKRRNIFLVIKELLHNSIKYSNASKLELHIKTDKTLEIVLSEFNAIGFDPNKVEEKGNGIFNMKKRMNAIGGNLQFNKLPDRMEILLSVPLDQMDQNDV